MKKCILLLVLVLLFSCTGTVSKYEKLIADAVQTDRRGTKLDLRFKADKIEEIGKISVADSIKIITDAFNSDREKRIGDLNETLRRNIDNMEGEKNSRTQTKVMMDFYQSNIERANRMIDSLRATSPKETAIYEGRNPDEIIAVIIRKTDTMTGRR